MIDALGYRRPHARYPLHATSFCVCSWAERPVSSVGRASCRGWVIAIIDVENEEYSSTSTRYQCPRASYTHTARRTCRLNFSVEISDRGSCTSLRTRRGEESDPNLDIRGG